MINKKIIVRIDSIILVFITIHIFAISFSIALASISFGIWAGLWILKMIFLRESPLEKSLASEFKCTIIFILIYLIFEFLSRTFAVIPENSYSGYKRISLILVFFGCIANYSSEKSLHTSLKVIGVVFALISLYEIIRFALDYLFSNGQSLLSFRISYFAHPLTTGEMKMMVLLLLLPLFSLKGKEFFKFKISLLFILLPIFIAMILTMSRNVYIAVFICFIIYGIVLNRKFLISFFLFLIVFWFIVPSQMKDRITSITDIQNNESNRSRIMMWQVGLKMIEDHPLLGIGDNEFIQVYQMYKPIQISGEGSHLHNNFLMIFATTGIFGFIGFCGFLISVFIKQISYYKKSKYEIDKLLIFGSLLAFLSFNIAGLFEWTFGSWQVLSIFLFIISIPFIIFKLKLNINKNG